MGDFFLSRMKNKIWLMINKAGKKTWEGSMTFPSGFKPFHSFL